MRRQTSSSGSVSSKLSKIGEKQAVEPSIGELQGKVQSILISIRNKINTYGESLEGSFSANSNTYFNSLKKLLNDLENNPESYNLIVQQTKLFCNTVDKEIGSESFFSTWYDPYKKTRGLIAELIPFVADAKVALDSWNQQKIKEMERKQQENQGEMQETVKRCVQDEVDSRGLVTEQQLEQRLKQEGQGNQLALSQSSTPPPPALTYINPEKALALLGSNASSIEQSQQHQEDPLFYLCSVIAKKFEANEQEVQALKEEAKENKARIAALEQQLANIQGASSASSSAVMQDGRDIAKYVPKKRLALLDAFLLMHKESKTLHNQHEEGIFLLLSELLCNLTKSNLSVLIKEMQAQHGSVKMLMNYACQSNLSSLAVSEKSFVAALKKLEGQDDISIIIGNIVGKYQFVGNDAETKAEQIIYSKLSKEPAIAALPKPEKMDESIKQKIEARNNDLKKALAHVDGSGMQKK